MSVRIYCTLSSSDATTDEKPEFTNLGKLTAEATEVPFYLVDTYDRCRCYYSTALARRVSLVEVEYLFTPEISKKYGVDEGVLRLLWNDYVNPMVAPYAAIWIGVDNKERYYDSISIQVSYSGQQTKVDRNFIKKQLKSYLIEIAKRRETVDYTTAGGRVGLKRDDDTLYELLSEISRETNSEIKGCYLSVLAGSKRNKNRPSDGFWKVVDAEHVLEDKDEALRVLKEKVYTAYCS